MAFYNELETHNFYRNVGIALIKILIGKLGFQLQAKSILAALQLIEVSCLLLPWEQKQVDYIRSYILTHRINSTTAADIM